jgi:hypothetical protein
VLNPRHITPRGHANPVNAQSVIPREACSALSGRPCRLRDPSYAEHTRSGSTASPEIGSWPSPLTQPFRPGADDKIAKRAGSSLHWNSCLGFGCRRQRASPLHVLCINTIEKSTNHAERIQSSSISQRGPSLRRWECRAGDRSRSEDVSSS